MVLRTRHFQIAAGYANQNDAILTPRSLLKLFFGRLTLETLPLWRLKIGDRVREFATRIYLRLACSPGELY